MKLLRKVGVTSEIWQIFIADSSSTTGAGLTGLVYNSASLTAYYHRDTDTTATAISLVTMTVGTFTSSGFKEIDSTNMPGWYQFCPPNAALASGAKSCSFHLKGATNMAPLPIEVDLQGDVNLTHIAGTVASTPATAGILDVNVKNMNNVAATSITTINANIGQTQPVNFTGTGASALVKSDMVDVAGAAVSTSTAQIGVNVVNFGGSAGTFASGRPEVNATHFAGTISPATAGYVGIDWAQISGKTTTNALTGTTIATTQKVDIETIKTNPVVNGGTITFPTDATVASTTNITAGTITTTTNLTNDPPGVTTLLTRIPSALFSGITSLAQWLGLIAGKQTGNSTARTELRATGAGSGTFDETTDSVEALRDRGDAAWITATGFSTHSAADVWAVGTRVLTAGTNIDGSTFTAIPWAAAWDAEVQSEVNDGLVAFFTSAAALVDLVWDEATSGHATAGTTGKALTDAGSAGDPWSTAIPGAYASGTAGYILGNKSGFSLASTGLDLVLVDGKTLPAAVQYVAASAAGKVSGAGTGTEVFKGLDGSTTRLTVTVDSSGNRSAVTYG